MTLDWNYITQRIATGARLATAADVQTVRAGGITHVLNLCREPDALGLLSCHLPSDDDGNLKSAEWFRGGIEFTFTALIVPRSRIYIHCNQGNQRGPSMVYAVLRIIGLTPKDAYDLIVRRRPKLLRYGTHIGYRQDADRALKELGFENEGERYLP